MEKHLLDDVRIKKNKKPIKQKIVEKEIAHSSEEGGGYIEKRFPKKSPHYTLWFLAISSMCFMFFAFSVMFSKAEVKVFPKITEINLNDSLAAGKERSSNNLIFNLVIISGEESRSIDATDEKEEKEAARGKVVLYNNFSTSGQTLDIDTRLEGSNGKIYKTEKRIVIPGKSKDGVPGSVEVGIYAVSPGADYNSVPLDFKILGFKGGPKYSQFYGRSSTEIAGGFSGLVPVVSEADKMVAIDLLKKALENKLIKKANDQVPADFLLYKEAIFLNLSEKNVSFVKKDNGFSMEIKGTLYGFLLDEKKLSKKILEKYEEVNNLGDVYISNIKDLAFSIPNKATILPESSKNINFTLSGTAKVVSRVNTNKLINDLLGKSKNDFYQTISSYGEIESAVLKLSPMWKMSIPNQIKNIEVNIEYPK